MMKKLMIGLLIATLCLTVCACGFSASANYPNADKYSIGSFTYDAANIDTVEINWISGRLELTESTKATLAVTETTQGLTKDQQMRWWQDGKTLRIQYWKSGYTGGLFNKEKRLTVEIPKDIALKVMITSGDVIGGNHQFKDLALTATSGGFQFGAVNADSLTAQLTSGNIKFGPIRANGKVQMECTSGKINIENVAAEAIALNATSGDITSGPMDAKSLNVGVTSGDIKLEAVKADTATVHSTSGKITMGIYQCGTVNISCTSGDIHLSTLHGSGATVDFKTNSGDLNGKVARKGIRQVINDGATAVTVNTTSGDLKLSEK